jgi:hypothetical protein
MSMTSRLEAVFDRSNRSEAKELAGSGEPTGRPMNQHVSLHILVPDPDHLPR